MNELLKEVYDQLTSGRTQAAVNLIEAHMRVERSVERSARALYEDLRGKIDGGAEGMTHADAVEWVERMSRTYDDPGFINELINILVTARGGTERPAAVAFEMDPDEDDVFDLRDGVDDSAGQYWDRLTQMIHRVVGADLLTETEETN